MATWRYSRYSAAEMAITSSNGGDAETSSKVVPEYFDDDNSEDLSYSELDEFPEFLVERAGEIKSLQLEHNRLVELPATLGAFGGLVSLDLSYNGLKKISDEIQCLVHLRSFIARSNCLSSESLPKDFGMLPSLQLLNFSGNCFTELPMQLTELPQLKCLYLGANKINSIPKEICNLHCLEVLYLGGNRLTTVPDELGYVGSLTSLVLCDNLLESLPRSLINLRSLQSLSLHNNRLSTLPPEIIRLNLVELSLRNNPLVVRFVEDMTYEPPSLLELSGRVIKMKNIKYSSEDLPANLVDYLNSAHSCVNPKCKGVYFTSRVEHVKFVDFCGKYRLPLLQYLCSPRCTSSIRRRGSSYSGDSSESDNEVTQPVASRLKKVLLG